MLFFHKSMKTINTQEILMELRFSYAKYYAVRKYEQAYLGKYCEVMATTGTEKHYFCSPA